MVKILERPLCRPRRPVLVRERFLSGRLGSARYAHALTVSLTTEAFHFQPAPWSGWREPFTLPLEAIILVYVRSSRLAPTIELYFHTSEGTQSCAFSPHNLRRWVEYLSELGLVLRPYQLELEALPRRNLGYHLLAAVVAGLGLSGMVGALLGLLRAVHGG